MNWDRINAVTNVVVIIGALVFLFRPEGPATRMISQYLRQMEQQEKAQAMWEDLSETESTMPRDAERIGLVVFADYQCPFCEKAHAALRAVRANRPELGIAFRHFPLDATHPMARPAALAAICATRQDRFPEINAFLYRSDTWEDHPNWRQVAKTVGVPDIPSFLDCMESEQARDRLETDVGLAHRLGIRSTPTFVHPNGIHRGVASGDEMADWMRAE